MDWDTLLTDNGLMDKTGNPLDQGLFKVPSVRNIAVSGPYMHGWAFRNVRGCAGVL